MKEGLTDCINLSSTEISSSRHICVGVFLPFHLKVETGTASDTLCFGSSFRHALFWFQLQTRSVLVPARDDGNPLKISNNKVIYHRYILP
jgi:hypothetical protein